MRRINAGRIFIAPAIASLLTTLLIGAAVLSLSAPDVVEAQTEPNTAANGMVLPPLDFDPVAARNADATAAGTPTPAGAPADGSAVADAPGSGNTVTTSLGGADVAVSSVGGSYEVDSPNKRSRKR